MKRVVIIGGGFGGLNAAKAFRGRRDVEITVLDRQNHHLFQPLLYQVAMAALSPADIAAPIRSILSSQRNVRVLLAEVGGIDLISRVVQANVGRFPYDALIVACGATHAYFGHEQWEVCAPGLKSLAQATEIRTRVLSAFESAEGETDPERVREWLTFVIVGGGPTGVELAGAIGEMSRYTLARDFRNVDPRQTKVILVEAGPRILPTFPQRLAARATHDLESLGVRVRVGAEVTGVSCEGVEIGTEVVRARTTLWAAGVRASALGEVLDAERDRAGRVLVREDFSLPSHREVFVVGDLAHRVEPGKDTLLPGVAQAAMQAGKHAARMIMRDLDGKPREPFRYRDLGQMATIGRSRAVCELGRARFGGRLAWWLWLVVHIYGLTGFRNRASVMVQWAWSFVTFGRGARLIVPREWRQYGSDPGR